MSNMLEGKKALIIGAGGGMGDSISSTLAREGVTSVLLGRSENALSEVADACTKQGSPGIPLVFDIAQLDSIEEVGAEATNNQEDKTFLIIARASMRVALIQVYGQTQQGAADGQPDRQVVCLPLSASVRYYKQRPSNVNQYL